MRRGLIAWSKEQVPPPALEARVQRVQQALGEQGLDALLAYTSIARPAAVSWLTHFIPYWNEAFVAVLPEGPPSLIASFSKRMHPWIREVSHVGEIVPAPDLGRAAAAFVEKRSLKRVGVVDLEHLPWSVAEPIGKIAELADASTYFAALRQPADRYENALAERAAQIAAHAFAAIPGRTRNASEILSAVESAARREGAEEIIPRISQMGDRHSVELSMAYKGVWIRLGRTYPSVPDAESWFEAALADHALPPPGRLARRTVESCIGSSPLSVVEDQDRVYHQLPAGAQAVLSVRLDLEDGPWRAAAPFLVRA
jgi:hypothetical protein